ncbi:HD domain-containing protein [Micromonospora sp. GCM10011542]|uniref:HD domain-containing protein n=1 Tax=Micromonospora sp. GCM10011542 TaxID=3317337 RepID=UPI0036119C7D
MEVKHFPKGQRSCQRSSRGYHHSRRVFLFSLIHAHKLGVKPDPELLYLAAMFHDTGLLTPFSDPRLPARDDGRTHGRFALAELIGHRLTHQPTDRKGFEHASDHRARP